MYYPKSPLAYAVTLLAKRRYSVAEITKKLSSKKIWSKEEIQEVIDKLLNLKYLNDAEYVSLYIDDQLRRKPQGIKIVKMNLKNKGLDSALVNKIILEKEGSELLDEVANIRKLIEKKESKLSKFPTEKRKEKLYRFLISRGFSPSKISELLFNE